MGERNAPAPLAVLTTPETLPVYRSARSLVAAQRLLRGTSLKNEASDISATAPTGLSARMPSRKQRPASSIPPVPTTRRARRKPPKGPIRRSLTQPPSPHPNTPHSSGRLESQEAEFSDRPRSVSR